MKTIEELYEDANKISLELNEFSLHLGNLNDCNNFGELRQELVLFANEMEKVLSANDDKKGWKNIPVSELFKKLIEEIGELGHELYGDGVNNDDIEDAMKEALDVANMAMMIYDNLRRELN